MGSSIIANGTFGNGRTILSFLLSFDTYVCVSGGKKCSFFRKFGVLCFLETPVLRFALLPYYRRISQCIFPWVKEIYIYLEI